MAGTRFVYLDKLHRAGLRYESYYHGNDKHSLGQAGHQMDFKHDSVCGNRLRLSSDSAGSLFVYVNCFDLLSNTNTKRLPYSLSTRQKHMDISDCSFCGTYYSAYTDQAFPNPGDTSSRKIKELVF